MAKKNKSGSKTKSRAPASAESTSATAGKRATPRGPAGFTASTADRHVLYELAVQNVESEIDFVDDEYKRLRGRRASRMREDFCGTANTACEWVRRRPDNTAVGLDLDAPTLEWGRIHNVGLLKPAQRGRVTLLERNVLEPGGEGSGADIVLAMNFSYWIFQQRTTMLEYFRSVRESLAEGGVFFLDHYGGPESMEETRDKRRIEPEDGPYKGKKWRFTYVWDQHKYNPITGEMECHIHFEFPDGTKMRRAFTYVWRLWSLQEIQDCLRDAGFSRVTVYWEGTDDDGEGDGVFAPAMWGETCPAFVTYISAEK